MWIVKYVYNITAIRVEQRSRYVFPSLDQNMKIKSKSLT